MIIKKTKFFPRLHANRFFHFYEAPWQLLRVYGDATLLYSIYMFSPDNSGSVYAFFCTLGALCAKISVLNNIHTHRRSVLSCEQKNTQNQRKLCGLFSIYGPASSVCECCLYFIFGYGIAWYSVVLSIYSCSHAHPPPAQTYTHTESMLATNDDICCTRRWFTAEYEM